MRRHALAVAILAGVGALSAAHARDTTDDHRMIDPTLDLAIQLASNPPLFEGLVHHALNPARTSNTRPSRELLDMIASWLSANFDLPGHVERPRVEFVSAAQLVKLRYRGMALDRAAYPDRKTRVEQSVDAPKIEGLYDDRTRVVYLPEGWQGGTAVETSVLVHEMVHHLQNLAGAKFSCPDEREELAFAAQDKWLAIFGKGLAEDFELDRLTVFAKTRCMY